jgi:predicted Zn-dependent protease
LSRTPVAIEPGRYTVILEPQAVGDLVQLLGGLRRRAVSRRGDEARSPSRGGGNKLGEKIMDERVSLFADPFDSRVLAQPFDGQGFPLGKQVFIENGVLKQLFYSRFWRRNRARRQPAARARSS